MRGFLYIIPLSFNHIQSVVRSKHENLLSNSLNFSTASDQPVRIQITESRQPILITPHDPDKFVEVCTELNPSANLFNSSAHTHHGV